MALVDHPHHWWCWGGFFIEIHVYRCSRNISIPILHFPMPQGRWEWMDGHGWLWMTLQQTCYLINYLIQLECRFGQHPACFWGRFSFLRDKTFKKWNFISSNINNSQGRGWGSPLASVWAESTEKEEKKWGGPMWVCSFVHPPSSLSPTCRHCTLCITIGSHMSSMCPMHRHWALHVVVVSYVSSSDSTCRRWGPTCLMGESARDGFHPPCLLLAAVDFEWLLLGLTHHWNRLALLGPLCLVVCWHWDPRPSRVHIAGWAIAGCCGVRHTSIILTSSLWACGGGAWLGAHWADEVRVAFTRGRK